MNFKSRYIITADNRQAKQAFQEIDNLQKKTGSGGRGGGIGDVLGGNLASQAITRLTSALASGGQAVFAYSQQVQQSKIALTTLTGSAATANKQIAELEALTRRSPLQFESVAKMAQGFKAAGIETSKLTGLIEDVGNIAAATGDLTADRMESIGLALTQVVSKGRVQNEELLQLQERGVNSLQILAQHLGKTTGEIVKMAEKGQISSQTLLDAFQAFSKANYGTAMEKQAETFGGAWQTIQNVVLQSSSKMFKPATDAMAKFAADTAKSLKDQEKQWGSAGVSLGYALGFAIGKGIRDWRRSPEGQDIALLFQNPQMFFAKQLAAIAAGTPAGYNAPPPVPGTAMGSLLGQRRRPGAVTPGLTVPGAVDAKTIESQRREAEQAEAKRIAAARAMLGRELAEREAMISQSAARIDKAAAGLNLTYTTAKSGLTVLQGFIFTEEEAMDNRRKMAMEFLDFRKELLARELEVVRGNADEEAEIQSKLKILAEERIETEFREDIKLAEFREEQFRKQLEYAESIISFEIEQAGRRLAIEEEILSVRRAQTEALVQTNMPNATPPPYAGVGPFGEAATGGLDHATGQIRSMDDVMRQLGETASDVFMQMGSGLGAMIESWVLLGDQANVSMKKMVASVLAGVAAQAATLSIFHVAMGIAALTPWGAAMYGSPAMHFKAAALWGAVAVGTALAGRALAGDAGKAGGSGSSPSAGASRSSSSGLTPISRQNELTFASGRPREGNAFQQAAAAIERLEAKIAAMRPGDVVTVGVKQSPGVIGEAVSRDINRNSSIGAKIARNIGMR
jgi:tape measure domain-containing protein